MLNPCTAPVWGISGKRRTGEPAEASLSLDRLHNPHFALTDTAVKEKG